MFSLILMPVFGNHEKFTKPGKEQEVGCTATSSDVTCAGGHCGSVFKPENDKNESQKARGFSIDHLCNAS